MAVEVKLPPEVVRTLCGKAATARRLRESLILELLRTHVISQGKAAELLRVDRRTLIEWMNAVGIPFFDYDAAEMDDGLRIARRLVRKSKTSIPSHRLGPMKVFPSRDIIYAEDQP